MKADKARYSEWAIAGVSAAALLLLINPWNLLMPPALVMGLGVAVAVLMIGFAVFWWREQPRDERESLNSLRAGRISYLAGGGVLLAGVVIQAFMHHIDPWLPLSLGAMVLAKLLVSAWWQKK
jgi:MFS family permease